MTSMQHSVSRFGRGAYLALYYLRSLVGQKRPLLGGIKLGHNCNLSCVQCPFRRRKVGSLSFSQVRSSLATLHERGVRLLILEGGEPLLWRDGEYTVKDVISEAKKLFFFVGVTTNGTLPLELEADNVWVSIDGFRETHDRLRGKSFDRIVANIESSTHPRIYAHITINAENWQEVPDLIQYLTPKVRGVTVQFFYPYPEIGDELFLPFDKRKEILDKLIELKRQGLHVAHSHACLEALKTNSWICRPWMIASVDPSGDVTQGCYLKNRGEISCERCGFSAHTEISLAYAGVAESILVGNDIFSLLG